jgi:hypothetical protein
MSEMQRRPASPASELTEDPWQVRVGQIETVLTFFGGVCSVSVERPDGDTVYVQAQRVDGGLEVEMTGSTYLDAPLDELAEEAMVLAGWVPPAPPVSPNFRRFVGEGDDLGSLAAIIAKCFHAVYGVEAEADWVVSPPEFGNQGAGLAPLEVLDLDDEASPMPSVAQLLREASGATLAAVASRDDITWQDLVEAGLPRGDRLAELAMLYRSDCPVEFLRKSPFHMNVLSDLALPASTAQAVAAADPSPWELRKLAKRGDVPRSTLVTGALRGAKLSHWRGRSARFYLSLGLIPPAKLLELSRQQDEDTVGMLRHAGCPEEIVRKHVLARSASVRLAALRAIRARNLAVESSLVELAGTLPVTEEPRTTTPVAVTVTSLADEILEAR